MVGDARERAGKFDGKAMDHAHGALFDPQTHGKIARQGLLVHQTLKNRILLSHAPAAILMNGYASGIMSAVLINLPQSHSVLRRLKNG